MNNQRYKPLLLILLTASSMVIGAKLNFNLNGSTVTLQTFFLCLTALYLKPKEAVLGQLLYLVFGFFAPVFASDYKGLIVFTGSSAGYLYAFIPAAYLLARYGKQQDFFTIVSWTMVSHSVVLLGGYLWLVFYTKFPAADALLYGVMQLLPGAFVKGTAAALFYFLSEKYLNKKKLKSEE